MSDKVGDFLLQEMKEQHSYYTMFYEMFFERSQLYGSLIYLMVENGVKEITLSRQDLVDANNFILQFIPDKETDTLKLQIIDNPDKEKNE